MFQALPPLGQLGYLLVVAADQVSRSGEAALRANMINPRQFGMLGLIASDPEISQAGLARLSFITPQSASESLARLEDAGLLVRTIEPGRPAKLALTKRGRGLLEEAYPLVESAMRSSFSVLTASERDDLARLLRKILDAQSAR